MLVGEQLTNTEVIHYGGRAFMAYELADLYGTTRMDFYGARPTESVNVPVWESDDASYFADGQDHLEDESEVTGHNIPLFEPLKSKTTIKRSQVDVRPDLKLLGRRGFKHGQAVGNKKTVTLTNFLAKTADAAGNVIEIDASNPSTLADEVKRGIKAIQVAMDRLEIPPQDRFGKVESGIFYEFPESALFYSKDFGGSANIQNYGMNYEIPIYNIKTGNCPLAFGTDWTDQAFDGMGLPDVAEFDMSNVIGVFWHADAWALRHQTQLRTSAGWVEHMQVWLTMARLHLGFGSVQTDGIWVLVNDAGT